MKTVVVLIGNSDDKLSQMSWSEFYNGMYLLFEDFSVSFEFSGMSMGNAWWQNACFVATVREDEINDIKTVLERFRKEFRQDSIAILVGDTEFI